MEKQKIPAVPRSQTIYGDVVYWLTILACILCMIGPLVAMINPENNLINPHFLFAAIFEGKSSAEIWGITGGEFPGGHFYLDYLTKGDGLTQLGLAIGCSVALWGLLASAVCFLKEKKPLYAVLSLWVCVMIAVAALGIISLN